LLFTVGTLPPLLRARLGLSWTSQDAARLERTAAWLRAAFSLVPPHLWTLPPAWRFTIPARLGRFA
jgi:uncharacterized protein (DUF2236 family)